ncbi:glutathione S-transferase family protein [Mesorhizobium sp. YIM 152430]|uniref:glutathione S-transferase family protein n=1 Tax=Mesorhizobium sp. YIM 152430 TaxID=3031761 RepID=UPI0023DC9224|nr:glutathione S-transferase family protein [Mesorhizobium sp. YIM 152430]MDF1601605.1 glutathione S-transferase family protein [Mesorhizobium sp. YIM 152430]
MIDLYHCVNARSFRPLWTLEEMGLAYTLHVLPFPPRYLAPGYKDMNPLGTIPLMIDGATRMTESAAICHYLATRHGPSPLAVTPDEADYGAYLNFLHMGEATLTFPQTLVLRYRHFEEEQRRLPQVADDYERWFLARLRAVDARLAGRDYLCAGRFTAADISVGYALMLAATIGLDAEFSDMLNAYFGRIRARGGHRRALERQAEGAKSLGPVDAFGRPIAPPAEG